FYYFCSKSEVIKAIHPWLFLEQPGMYRINNLTSNVTYSPLELDKITEIIATEMKIGTIVLSTILNNIPKVPKVPRCATAAILENGCQTPSPVGFLPITQKWL
ncbi:MAG TPA: hypothetical protein VKR58_03010, partial [Aquella sp.]|nr:hypothetical protein [Aquella sp.]